MTVLLVLDGELRSHLLVALEEHRRRWCRTNGVRVPASVDAFIDVLAAPGGDGGCQAATLLDGAAGGPHDAGVSLMTYRQAAARLNVSTRSVERLVAAGRLPAVRLGRLVRFRAADLEEIA